MKTLSYLFTFTGIAFLLVGLAFLTINQPTATTEKFFLSSFFGGMVSIVAFLISEKLTVNK